jgi:curli biogenesis system outer membrane secretion channel CsgG
MKCYLAILTSALTILTIFPAFPQQPQPEKRRLAVLDFQYGTVMSSVQAIFGTTHDVGRGISDLLIDKLVKDGTYRVIERRDIGKIVGEQNFSNSDRADPATAARIGRLLGVDTVIIGDITQFGRDDKTTGIGAIASRWDKYGIGNIGVRKAKAVVAVTARLIDVNTGEIVASESGKGESARSGTNLLGGGGAGGTGGGGNVDMSSSNFGQTIIGEAVGGAVTALAVKLVQDSIRVPHQTVQVSGLVADAGGNTMVINVGRRNGVHVGDRLVVTRVTRVIKDPVTGKPLRSVETLVGELQITSVEEGSAEGTFTGTDQPKIGDAVKTPQ